MTLAGGGFVTPFLMFQFIRKYPKRYGTGNKPVPATMNIAFCTWLLPFGSRTIAQLATLAVIRTASSI